MPGLPGKIRCIIRREHPPSLIMITPDHQVGVSLHLNIYNCDEGVIRNENLLGLYAKEVADLIGSRRQGDPLVGNTESMPGIIIVQLMDRASITGHISNELHSAYIDIFSFDRFDDSHVIQFSKEFFRATSTRSKLLYR